MEIANALDRFKTLVFVSCYWFDLYFAGGVDVRRTCIDRLLAMSRSLIDADRRLHLRIVGVAAALGMATILACWNMDPAETRKAAIIKASPLVVTSERIAC